MTQVDDYKSPWKDKYATTVNNTAYTFLNSYDDEISYLDKMVEAIKEPIKDTHVHNTAVGTTSFDSVVNGFRIIGQWGRRSISRGTSIISSNVITHVLIDSSKMILKSGSFALIPFKSKTRVIASQSESFLSCDRNLRTSSDIGYSRRDHGRIGTPFVNKHIWSGDDNFSVRSEVGEANKLVTAVQRSSNNERNTASL